MPIDAQRLVQWIRDRRVAADLTQQEAADRAGFSLSTWNAIENGRRRGELSASTKRKVATALGVAPLDIDQAMTSTDPDDPPAGGPIRST